MDIGFNVHIQSKLLSHTIVVGASSDIRQPFVRKKEKEEASLGYTKKRFFHYDIRGERALPPIMN